MEKPTTYVSEMKRRIKLDTFRMMILGMTGGGKTFLLANSILPAVKSKFDKYLIFIRDYNINVYKKMMEKLKIKEYAIFAVNTTRKKDSFMMMDILPTLEAIAMTQEKNRQSADDIDGHPKYKYRLLIIFDDILDERMMKSERFLELFVNFRHINISVILLSQISNKDISTQLKANTHYTVMFKLKGPMQNLYSRQLIAESLMGKGLKESAAKDKSLEVYNKYIMGKKYGWLMVDDESKLS